ncbi:MAG: hypothetical protein LDL11_06275 [Desulfarculus sp.]|nr:hypothetical protein [Desulfarculus sp.]
MRISRELLARPGLQWLVFCLGLALFLWPYLSDGDWPPERSYAFFFICWAALVLFLALSAQARSRALRRDRQENTGRG